MTLADMLAAHDPATLETMTSKGLVRRASKQAQADDLKIEAIDTSKAVVMSEGQTIAIDTAGPAKASCTCPATGICRHILTAVLVLQSHGVTDDAPSNSRNDSPNGTAPDLDAATAKSAINNNDQLQTAFDSLSKLSAAQLKKFAGADWADANHLASQLLSEQQKPQIISQGHNSVVILNDGQYSVTFIAGSSLKDALFKGPKTKKRLVTVAGALILRNSAGIAIEVTESTVDAKTLSNSYLLEAQTVLENGAVSVLGGAADTAADKFFDLAISARVQVAPRLSSQLRTLSKMALKAKDHSIDFHANDFLVLLARTYALVCGLQASPKNPKLTGSLRRDYTVAGPLTLWVLGAKHWTMPGGARGVTAYAYSEEKQTWYSSAIARAAGMQLTFDPYRAYEETLWGAYSMSALVGKCVRLEQPGVSVDQQIVPSQQADAQLQAQVIDDLFIKQSSGLVDAWPALFSSIQQRFGQGLTRGMLPIPQLVKPARFGALTFDEFSQTYYWEIFDNQNDVIQLEMPADYSHRIDDLRSLEKRIKAILIEAVIFNDELHFLPISLLVDGKGEFQVLNIQFHQLWNQRVFDRMLKRFKDKVLPVKQPEVTTDNPLAELANSSIDLIVNLIAYPHYRLTELDSLIKQCEVAGLLSLARVMKKLQTNRKPSQLLAAVYIASELSIVSGLQKHAG